MTGSQRASHRSSRSASDGSTRPRASSSSASLAASARNRAESPTAIPGCSSRGRPSRSSSAPSGWRLRAGTTHGCKRSGRRRGASSSSARSSPCGFEHWGPSPNDGSITCSSRPRPVSGCMLGHTRRSTPPSSSAGHTNGCARGRGFAGGRPGRFGARGGSAESSAHRNSRESRDQMACTAITGRNPRASPGRSAVRGGDTRR